MFERFTGDARQVVVLAQEQARELRHPYIGTEHLLLGLVHLPDEVGVRRALLQLGVTADVVRVAVEQLVGCGTTTKRGHIPFTPRAKQVLELSLREALRLRCNHIGPEHLLLGILQEGEGVAAQILVQHGRSFDEIRALVTAASDTAPVSRPGGPQTPAAAQILALAERLAAGAPVGSHHLLEALARTDTSMGGKALAGLGVSADAVVGQVDALDVADTTDGTPEQAAAATMRWEVGADSATLVTADPDTVARLRRAIDLAGGEITGNGPLAGPFIGLHRAIRHAVEAFEAALSPDPPADGPPTTLRERLRRRRSP